MGSPTRQLAETGAILNGFVYRAPLETDSRNGRNKGIARVKFLPGKVEEWKRLSEQAMEIVRTRDSGTL